MSTIAAERLAAALPHATAFGGCTAADWAALAAAERLAAALGDGLACDLYGGVKLAGDRRRTLRFWREAGAAAELARALLARGALVNRAGDVLAVVAAELARARY